jgi:hypothetical protein
MMVSHRVEGRPRCAQQELCYLPWVKKLQASAVAATLAQASPLPSRRLSGRCTQLDWPTMLLAPTADAPRSFWLTALRQGVTMYFTDLPHFLDSTAAIGTVKGHPLAVHSSTSRTGKAACGLARRF